MYAADTCYLRFSLHIDGNVGIAADDQIAFIHHEDADRPFVLIGRGGFRIDGQLGAGAVAEDIQVFAAEYALRVAVCLDCYGVFAGQVDLPIMRVAAVVLDSAAGVVAQLQHVNAAAAGIVRNEMGVAAAFRSRVADRFCIAVVVEAGAAIAAQFHTAVDFDFVIVLDGKGFFGYGKKI